MSECSCPLLSIARSWKLDKAEAMLKNVCHMCGESGLWDYLMLLCCVALEVSEGNWS